MKRNVNLVSYLPSFLAEFKENIALFDAENPEFDFLWNQEDQEYFRGGLIIFL